MGLSCEKIQGSMQTNNRAIAERQHAVIMLQGSSSLSLYMCIRFSGQDDSTYSYIPLVSRHAEGFATWIIMQDNC